MSGDKTLQPLLEQGLAELGIALEPQRIDLLLRYVALLHKWNGAYNLTAVRDPRDMVVRHLLDSLSILPWVTGPSLLDVGAGAGLPGIVLAIARPELAVTLLDSNGKKVRFQRQAVLELGLDNVVPLHQRVESLDAGEGFAQIVSRAFAAVEQFIGLSRSLIAADGEWLAMVGQLNEAPALPADVALIEQTALKVPGERASRHLLRIAPVRS
ncbi:16S rRNA (guanine(527)-N(7))-methyltransferase RsmG [Carnimonas nigrificans]|uniref:16S rRNA (guanine(527)-N(7))-methyltransferase RsmG n=1 Tax=Carnimonas nigrificans TaxID=64323 RepID=UPI00046E92BE|nr:16S rRNA (guanine(527)-N(7))-methyltransferase RsmG [Carnimonas nigrificans]